MMALVVCKLDRNQKQFDSDKGGARKTLKIGHKLRLTDSIQFESHA